MENIINLEDFWFVVGEGQYNKIEKLPKTAYRSIVLANDSRVLDGDTVLTFEEVQDLIKKNIERSVYIRLKNHVRNSLSLMRISFNHKLDNLFNELQEAEED